MAKLFGPQLWFQPPPRQRLPFGVGAVEVWVRETLIDLNGAAVASETNIFALIFHSVAAVEAGTPNEVVSGVSTNAAGLTGFQINRGTLNPGNPIYMVLFKNGAPVRFGARRIVPSYE